jgi:hypothetical protein
VDRVLRLRARQLRRPTVIPERTTSTVHLKRNDYDEVATDVPFWKAPKSGFIRQGEYGTELPSNDVGFTRPDREVRVQDLFEVGDDTYEVMFLGNIGVHVRAFDIAKVVLA